MEYRLKVNGDIITAEVEPGGEGEFRVGIGEKTYRMSCLRISENHLNLTVDGEVVNAYVHGGLSKEIFLEGRNCRVEDADEAGRGGTSSKSREKPGSVTPPMPSVVVKVLVRENDDVNKGAPVMVVSAMKLETTLTAPYNGTVKSVNAAEGDKVMPGQVLVYIEKTGPAEDENE